MARTLRLRFIFIAIGALTATLALLCTAINLGYGVIQTRQADTVIDLLYQHGGDFPAPEERPLRFSMAWRRLLFPAIIF